MDKPKVVIMHKPKVAVARVQITGFLSLTHTLHTRTHPCTKHHISVRLPLGHPRVAASWCHRPGKRKSMLPRRSPKRIRERRLAPRMRPSVSEHQLETAESRGVKRAKEGCCLCSDLTT